MEDFVQSSSTRAYSDSIFRIKTPIEATIENSRMTQFNGNSVVIDELRKQLERAAKISGGDAYVLNS